MNRAEIGPDIRRSDLPILCNKHDANDRQINGTPAIETTASPSCGQKRQGVGLCIETEIPEQTVRGGASDRGYGL